MAQFKDADGRLWTIELLRPDFKRVKQELNIDLLDVSNKALWARLLTDLELIVDLVWVLCSRQIASLQETDKKYDAYSFAKAMRGDALDRASEAVLEALIDFFPNRQRTLLKQALANTKTIQDKFLQTSQKLLDNDRLLELADLEIAELDQEIDQRIAELRAKQNRSTGGKSSANGADTSGPIPTA